MRRGGIDKIAQIIYNIICGTCGEAFDTIKNGLVGDKFYVNNELVKTDYVTYEYEGKLYYIGANYKIVRNKVVTYNGVKMYFGEDGVLYTGKVVADYGNYTYAFEGGYQSNVLYGLFEDDNGDVYYVGDNHRIAKNKAAYVTLKNGARTYWYFGADGKKATGTIIAGDRVFHEGEMVKAYNIVKVGDSWYQVAEYNKIKKNKRVYINDPEISPVKGYHAIDENGVIQLPNA